MILKDGHYNILGYRNGGEAGNGPQCSLPMWGVLMLENPKVNRYRKIGMVKHWFLTAGKGCGSSEVKGYTRAASRLSHGVRTQQLASLGLQ
ncbi:hypothetical protein J6590_020796 [Homalodisca vitripennis]|nr:hypothetical protein J6590_020796 [Homalodisca vitripennis]